MRGIFFQVEGMTNFSASGWGDTPHHTPPPFPQIGHKLENFPWGHQKQVGKFQNLQVYIEYGFLHNALKLDSNAHTKLI